MIFATPNEFALRREVEELQAKLAYYETYLGSVISVLGEPAEEVVMRIPTQEILHRAVQTRATLDQSKTRQLIVGIAKDGPNCKYEIGLYVPREELYEAGRYPDVLAYIMERLIKTMAADLGRRKEITGNELRLQ